MNKTIRVILLILLAIHYVVLSWHFIPHVSDDGGIYARYVHWLSQEGRLVWNPDQPVEGFSSPLWLILLSIVQIVGIPFAFASKMMGFLCGALTITLIFYSVGKKHGDWWAIMATVGSLTNMGFFYWMGSGLETPLLTLLWVWTFVSWGSQRGLIGLSLMGVVRPEGPFLCLLGLAFWPASKRPWSILIPAVAWWSFRLLYFGAIFPNTYYAKVGGVLFSRLTDGFNYVFPVALIWLAGAVLLGFRKQQRAAWLWVGAGIFAVFWGGGDWMWWGRMLVPFAIMSCLLVPRSWKEAWVLLPVVYGLFQLSVPYKAVLAAYSGKRLPSIGFQEGTLYEQSIEQAAYIRANLPSGDLIAINHAGFLPAELPEYDFLDMTGLNNSIIASSSNGGLHQKYDVEYVLEQNPSAIVFHRRGNFNIEDPLKDAHYWVGEQLLWNSSVFQERYVLANSYWERRGSGGAVVFSFIALNKSTMEERSIEP